MNVADEKARLLRQGWVAVNAGDHILTQDQLDLLIDLMPQKDWVFLSRNSLMIRDPQIATLVKLAWPC